MAGRSNFYPLAGKEVLIKVVAMAMPNHAMSCFKLPVSLCREIESEIAQKDGGMGFRDLVCFNLAMLAKIGWRILGQPQSLLGKVLHDKYHHGVGFLDARLGRKVSWGWRGILQGRRILLAGLRWRVGNGERIRVTEDPWLPKPYTFKTSSRHPELPMIVAELIDSESKAWRCDLISQLFEPHEVRLITSMPISRWGCPDRLVWHFHKQGAYTVPVWV
ncbi:hypothetical protein L3X38_020235 [Prunus dulcis]|uniref:Uncharacterized protein n=1 Tax=Prunus dulcis TaxID=3755 RepID=A0AAD4WD66_PRUDU|nr:hypothetical protein L3X38_020235 [Prunus dulcis]